MNRSLTLSEGAQLIADGAEGLVLGKGGVVSDPALHVHHHLLLLVHKHMLWLHTHVHTSRQCAS